MEIQKYLRSGKTFQDLEKELGIYSSFHPELPLVILNYDQIESQKTDPIVRECRGLVLNVDNFSLVAPCIPRFFNWGEVAHELELFNWNNFCTQEKVDGSLVTIFYFNEKWYAKTRGSWAKDTFPGLNMTWNQAFLSTLEVSSLEELKLDPEVTYICEFCSLYNKVVREYKTPCMYLLTAFRGNKELHWEEIPEHDKFLRPTLYSFSSVEEIKEFIEKTSVLDATYEGVVIRDNNNRRHKLKSATYVSLHQMKGNNNLFHPKYLLPFILNGETSEVILYFNEVESKVREIEEKILTWEKTLLDTWENAKGIESQKDFAQAVSRVEFSGILFTARKTGTCPKKLFRQAESLILKKLV